MRDFCSGAYSTAITRQFLQSTPNFEGSIWSRLGNPCPRASSVQSRSTRSTSRRLNTTFTVSEIMFDIVSVSGNIRAWTSSLFCCTLRASCGTNIRSVKAEIADRNCASDWPYIPLTLIWPVEPAYRCLAASPSPSKMNCRITACRGHVSTEQQLGDSTDWLRDCFVSEDSPQALCRDFCFRGISDKYCPP